MGDTANNDFVFLSQTFTPYLKLYILSSKSSSAYIPLL